jgi:hypothetical protein
MRTAGPHGVTELLAVDPEEVPPAFVAAAVKV